MMKKIIILTLLCTGLITLASCGSSSASVARRYNALEAKFDDLVDDTINESSRRSLEKKYRKLDRAVLRSGNYSEVSSYHSQIQDKIQYLQDLKD